MTNTTTNTLSINFYAEDITEEKKNEFMVTVNHASALMEVQLINDNIARLNKKIENKNERYTEEEIVAFRSQVDALNEEGEKVEEYIDSTKDVYTSVIGVMSEKNSDHFGNKKDVVETVLRVLGTWDNSKLVKYAIIPAFESPELYECLESIHVNSSITEDGRVVLSDSVKTAYKEATKHLETIIKTTFSLPFETPYTAKTRVKLTAQDRKLLHDCYISGFSNKFSCDDKGNVNFSERKIRTLVSKKTDRQTGKTTYNYSKLASTICNIVIKHYFA